MDDLVIATKNEEDAKQKLEKFLELARLYGLEINWKKCQLLFQSNPVLNIWDLLFHKDKQHHSQGQITLKYMLLGMC